MWEWESGENTHALAMESTRPPTDNVRSGYANDVLGCEGLPAVVAPQPEGDGGALVGDDVVVHVVRLAHWWR